MSRRERGLVAVDWGTSHLRIWLLDPHGNVLAERRSDQGMAKTPRGRFGPVLEDHLAALEAPAGMPVVMCGMVGARQGWTEANYLPVPVSLDGIAGNAVRVDDVKRDIRILPGLSKTDRAAPDVMRSEEAQLLGLNRLAPVADEEKRVVCMPGTHSKWVHMQGRIVVSFASFMTGELFDLAASRSVLRHSVSQDPFEPRSPEFRRAVEASLENPADILARLFSIRPAGLLHGLGPIDARARLSGYLIGQEIAGVRSRFALPERIDLIGSHALGALYEEALGAAGVTCRVHDGDALVIAGLTEAAAALWPAG